VGEAEKKRKGKGIGSPQKKGAISLAESGGITIAIYLHSGREKKVAEYERGGTSRPDYVSAIHSGEPTAKEITEGRRGSKLSSGKGLGFVARRKAPFPGLGRKKP